MNLHDCRETGLAQRLPYQAPVLLRYGTVRDLTQAGSANADESASGANCNFQRKPHQGCTPSERSLKENIARVGTHPIGIGLYLFNYKPAYRAKWGAHRQFGVMVDEVESLWPEAVVQQPDGMKLVNYPMLGIDR